MNLATIAIELGMDKGTVSKFINRLYKKGLINKTTVSYPSHEGGKPKRLRTITVINIELWTEKGKTIPTVLPIEKKHKAVKETVIEPINETPVSQPETKPIETIVVEQPTELPKEQPINKVENVLSLGVKDITVKKFTLEHIASEIQKGAKFKFVPVKYIDENKKTTDDEAMQLPSMKIYALKSMLLKINPSLFD